MRDTSLTKLFETLSNSTNNAYFYYSYIKDNKSIWSKSAVEYFNLPGQVLDPMTIWDSLVHPDDIHIFNESFKKVMTGQNPHHNVEYRIKNKNNEYIWVSCQGYMEYDENNKPSFFAGIVTPLGTITKVDPVTGLWTKYGLTRDLSTYLDNDIYGSILQVDVNNFKKINEAYGYEFGEKVIYAIGQRLMSICKDKAYVYRLDGAQFAILIPSIKIKPDDIYEQISKFAKSYIIERREFSIDYFCASINFPADGFFPSLLIDNLNLTLQTAKIIHNKELFKYSPEVLKNRALAYDLRDDLMNDLEDNFKNFRIVFQPLMDLHENDLFSAEVLLRWSNPKWNVGPADFIPILEDSHKIIEIGKWVCNEAVRYVLEWNLRHPTKPLKHVNVNVSYIQFMEGSLRNYLIELLDKNNLPRDLLVLELTESCRVDQDEKLTEILEGFHNAGFLISLDDFGSGYASLSVLRDNPVDIVKLDYFMIHNIDNKIKDRKLVEFIISYCRQMGIKVCSEGVETKEVLDIVSNAGSAYVQGFYYDRPLEAEDFYSKYLE